MFGTRLYTDEKVKIDARELYLLKRWSMKVTLIYTRKSKVLVL